MRRCKLCALFFVLFSCLSCYSYTQIRIVYRYDLATIPSDVKIESGARGSEFIYRKLRHLARISGSSPVARMNNKAVSLCIEGKFPEAKTLFEQVILDFPDEAATLNNIGVVNEVSGNLKKAMQYYLDACMKDPGNTKFINNYNSAAFGDSL